MGKDLILGAIESLRAKVLNSPFMTVDEQNRAIDALDDLQETVAYRDLPVIEY